MRERWPEARFDVPGLDVRGGPSSETGMDHEPGELRLLVWRQLAELSDRGGRESLRQLLEQVFQDRSIDRQLSSRSKTSLP